ncbi:MAG: hypothetical protein KGH88_04850 [Thaumarchaeota archaeon]|nr:hypothetical protein [Nitrososphaerota archaeon]
MIRQSNNPFKIKMLFFIAIYASLAVFSLAWYHVLTNITCDLTKPLSSNKVRTDSSASPAQDCSEQLHFHWIKFYGINGLIYGASIFVLVANVRKNNKN